MIPEQTLKNIDIPRLVAFILFLVLIVGVTFCAYLHHRAQNSALQKSFLAGTIPSLLPDGLYTGTVGGTQTTWKGKKFNRAEQRGINVFQDDFSAHEAYPFKTYVGTGAVDKQIQTVKIDYNLPENPLWLRVLLDEIVETTPGNFLGKLEIQIFPSMYITLGYFELKAPAQ
jgi:hypothetical protein